MLETDVCAPTWSFICASVMCVTSECVNDRQSIQFVIAFRKDKEEGNYIKRNLLKQ